MKLKSFDEIWYKIRGSYKSSAGEWHYQSFGPDTTPEEVRHWVENEFEYGDPEGIRPSEFVKIKRPPKKWLLKEIEGRRYRIEADIDFIQMLVKLL